LLAVSCRPHASILPIYLLNWGFPVKKGVIGLLLLVVLIIIVSPGIVGKFAEDSVGENLNWAASESGELVVTSEGFDRGWFSSEGQHRIELGEGQVRTAMMSVGGGSDDLPVLVINTHIDHGLIPVSSMSREQGSLAPGLGSAVSTMSVEFGDAEAIDLPGTIYSKVGIGGDLDSRYVVDAGTKIVEDGEVTWQPTTINIASSARTGGVEFNGDIGAMTFGNDQQIVSINGLTFEGEQEKSPYNFHVGSIDMSMGEMTINANGAPVGGMQGMSIKGSSSVDDGRATADMQMEMNGQSVPDFGEISIIADMEFEGLDAAAIDVVSARLDELTGGQDPTMIMMSAQEEFKDLFAAGLNVAVEQFDVAMPMGTVEMKMTLEVPESDRATFEWTSLLLGVEATFDIVVPEQLIQLATSMNPQAGAIVGMGYLKKEGDVYIMDADFKKGLLTINGAPIPIPMGAF
jgi:uncharacterized protein YdgA (DUF945 family)